MEPMVKWLKQSDPSGIPYHWELVVGRGRKRRIAAVVYDNGVWHTFDHEGIGGENDAEKTVERAKVEAAASAIAQGFI